jgi:hypothetical protein
MRLDASIPFIRGRPTSSKTTSGCVCVAFSIASRPSRASPTICQCACFAITERVNSRQGGKSSANRMRHDEMEPKLLALVRIECHPNRMEGGVQFGWFGLRMELCFTMADRRGKDRLCRSEIVELEKAVLSCHRGNASTPRHKTSLQLSSTAVLLPTQYFSFAITTARHSFTIEENLANFDGRIPSDVRGMAKRFREKHNKMRVQPQKDRPPSLEGKNRRVATRV